MPGRLKKYGKGADKKAGGEAGAGADAGGAASPAPPSTADTFSGIAGPAHTFNAPVAAEGKQRVGGELGDWEDKQLDVRQGVAAAVLIHVAFSIGFAVPAFVLAYTPFGGSNGVITTVALMGYNALLVLGLHTSFGPTLFGALLGATLGFAFISLQNAIYWGQLAACGNSDQYGYDWGDESCSNPGAMKAACAFASLLFILQTILAVVLIAWVDSLCPGLHDNALLPRRRHARDGRGAYEAPKGDGEVTVVLPTHVPMPHYQVAS